MRRESRFQLAIFDMNQISCVKCIDYCFQYRYCTNCVNEIVFNRIDECGDGGIR